MQVGFVQQQVTHKRVKKSYTPPTDPLWENQWSLVCVRVPQLCHWYAFIQSVGLLAIGID